MNACHTKPAHRQMTASHTKPDRQMNACHTKPAHRQMAQHTDNNGHDRVRVAGRSDVSIATAVHCDGLLAVADEVTVLAGRQSGLEGLVKPSLAHDEKSLSNTQLVKVSNRSQRKALVVIGDLCLLLPIGGDSIPHSPMFSLAIGKFNVRMTCKADYKFSRVCNAGRWPEGVKCLRNRNTLRPEEEKEQTEKRRNRET